MNAKRDVCLIVVMAIAGFTPLPAQESPERPVPTSGRTSLAVTKGKTFTNGAGLRMIWVKPGKFLMGSPPEEEGRNRNEDQVEVEITMGFWLGATEVMSGQRIARPRETQIEFCPLRRSRTLSVISDVASLLNTPSDIELTGSKVLPSAG